MKLDNHGWGTKEMIIMSSILFFLLLIVTVSIYSFYNNMGSSFSIYDNLESRIKAAAERYANENGIVIGRVTSTELEQGGYLNTFIDSRGRDCSGYVEVNNAIFTPYISCPDYKTKK